MHCHAHRIKVGVANSTSSYLTMKRKLMLLLLVASLALISIVLISEQLVQRHFSNLQGQSEVIQLDILTLEQWARREYTDILPIETEIQYPQSDFIEDGIYWSQSLESRISPGPSDQQVQDLLHNLRNRKVSEIQNPDWLHCGREKNRLVHFADGGQACARNRDANVEYIQGEVMAFYLARLLGINHTPVVALSKVFKLIRLLLFIYTIIILC